MILTLLSDLGTRDASVPIAKAMLMGHAPDAVLVDVAHTVVPYDLQQAAYLLLSAYRYFPAGTVHLLLVDVFSGPAPRLLLAQKDGHYFIAPDNGVLSLAFGAGLENKWSCFEFSGKYAFSNWVDSAGKVIAAIEKKSIAQFTSCDIKMARRLLQPQAVARGLACNILYIDRYENVVLDITRTQFDEYVQGRPFKIQMALVDEDITVISNNYNDVPAGEPLCRFNSAGFLEIALNHGSAAALLGLGSYSAGNLRYQTIRIFF